MKPYSKDLRLKVLAAVRRRRPRDTQGAGRAGLRRVVAHDQALPEAAPGETGDVEPKPVPGPQARKGALLEVTLPGQVHEENPDATLEEHREAFEEAEGVRVSTASVSRALSRLGLPLKKRRP